MAYISKDEKIKDFLDNKIISRMGNRNLDYLKTISLISAELGISEDKIIEVLNIYIKAEKLKCFLELPITLMEKFEKDQDEIKKEIKEVGLNGDN